MRDDSSYQALAGDIDSQIDRLPETADESPITSKADTMQLRTLMSQREMETLTSWFPKTARTLAQVLRSRAHRIDDEL